MRPFTAINKLPTNILTVSSAAPARLRALQPQCGGLRGPSVVALPPSLRTFESQTPEPLPLVSRLLALSEIKLSAPWKGRRGGEGADSCSLGGGVLSSSREGLPGRRPELTLASRLLF